MASLLGATAAQQRGPPEWGAAILAARVDTAADGGGDVVGVLSSFARRTITSPWLR